MLSGDIPLHCLIYINCSQMTRSLYIAQYVKVIILRSNQLCLHSQQGKSYIRTLKVLLVEE